jgi:hypothetical protein
VSRWPGRQALDATTEAEHTLDRLLAVIGQLGEHVAAAQQALSPSLDPGDSSLHGLAVLASEVEIRVPEIAEAARHGDAIGLCSAARTLVSSGIVFESYELSSDQDLPALNLVLDSLGQVALVRAELCRERGWRRRSLASRIPPDPSTSHSGRD